MITFSLCFKEEQMIECSRPKKNKTNKQTNMPSNNYGEEPEHHVGHIILALCRLYGKSPS